MPCYPVMAIAALRAAWVAAALLPITAMAQYGDAYHRPDFGRLQQQQQQRATQTMNEHQARIAPSSAGPAGSSSPMLGTRESNWDMGSDDYRSRQSQAVQAGIDVYDAKMRKFEELLKTRQLQRTPQFHRGVKQAYIDAGFGQFDADRVFGATPADYQAILVAYAPSGTPTYTGSKLVRCDNGCTETLKTLDGGTYVGATLAGRPHGPGSFTVYSGDVLSGNFQQGRLDGQVVVAYADGTRYEGGYRDGGLWGKGKLTLKNGNSEAGEFEDGRLTGEAVLTSVGASARVRTGRWVRGKPEGIHTIRFASGTVVVIDHGQPERSSITWPTGNVFVGQLDGARPVKGRLTYANSASYFDGVFDERGLPQVGTQSTAAGLFTGELADSRRVRGTLETPKYIFVGVFSDAGRPRAGQITIKSNNAVLTGYFDAAFKRDGYTVDQHADGSVDEMIFAAGVRAGPVVRTRTNGDVIAGMTNQPGYQIMGMYTPKGGAVRAMALDAAGAYVDLPAEQHGMAQQLALQAATQLAAERERLRLAIEQ